ncbi:uncharacterized protein LOC107779148 isoform X2 [Nicotiana tabacum]|uniref:Uncharacterized protein LOC107779148 isoform X2 n=1 Tax=Nicotiana tabacum TaxID=4097 RepID=A0A1S3YS60_TOBAC|nr:uncharacterized protein LOC104109388 isoform X3 [Nicotiana tomentosiformis]XP_016454988.1 PREDICTED: uncharacterized protein LOC107779148 isoform X4 [Nicotiana tabacum]
MSFLGFAFLIIDFLAWPVLALGYPLCASIRAIETGSEYHMRKLITYWTIFSFISLFEHVFEKLIEWVPLWPYIKLITICWLVIPQFNGACYFYQNLIHPSLLVKLDAVITQFYGSCYVYQRLLYSCLSVNLQIVTDWLNKPMEDPSLDYKSFLAMAERYLEENGSDDLVKLIASKSKDYSLNHYVEEIKTIDASDEAGMLIPNQVKSVRENLIWIEKKTTGTQVNETAAPTNQVNQLKQEEVKHAAAVRSEHSTNEELKEKVHLSAADLNGREHLVKLQKTMSSTAVAEENECSAPEELIANKSKDHSLNHHGEGIKATDICDKAGILTPSQAKPDTIFPGPKLEVVTPTSKPSSSSSLKENVKVWSCAHCQISTTSEGDLNEHLQGKKHKKKEAAFRAEKDEKNYNIDPLQNKPKSIQFVESCNDLRIGQKSEECSLGPNDNDAPSLLIDDNADDLRKNVYNTTHEKQNSKEHENREFKFWCETCKVGTLSEKVMEDHKMGKKHARHLRQLEQAVLITNS